MSADPDAPERPIVMTSGLVMKNMVYESDQKGAATGTSVRLPVSADKKAKGGFEADQDTIKPFRANMSKEHPCFEANTALGTCADNCDPRMMLAGRVSECNTERLALMKCLVKNKRFEEKELRSQAGVVDDRDLSKRAVPWYQIWLQDGNQKAAI